MAYQRLYVHISDRSSLDNAPNFIAVEENEKIVNTVRGCLKLFYGCGGGWQPTTTVRPITERRLSCGGESQNLLNTVSAMFVVRRGGAVGPSVRSTGEVAAV